MDSLVPLNSCQNGWTRPEGQVKAHTGRSQWEDGHIRFPLQHLRVCRKTPRMVHMTGVQACPKREKSSALYPDGLYCIWKLGGKRIILSALLNLRKGTFQ